MIEFFLFTFFSGTCSGKSLPLVQSSVERVLLGALYHKLAIDQTINDMPEWPEKTRQAKIALKKSTCDLKRFCV